MANVTGSFTETGQSASFEPKVGERMTQSGMFNVFLSGAGTATIQLERSPDNGTTWCAIYVGSTQMNKWTYTGTNLSETVEESEPGVIYRLNCTAWTSAVTYRISGAA